MILLKKIKAQVFKHKSNRRYLTTNRAEIKKCNQ